MPDFPVRRPMHSRRVGARAIPFRGGRMHPLAMPVDTDQPAGVKARVLADQERAKKRGQT